MPWIWSSVQGAYVWARNQSQANREQNNRNNLHDELQRLRQNEIGSAERLGELRSELQQQSAVNQAWCERHEATEAAQRSLEARLQETQMEFLSERAAAQEEAQREKQVKDAEETARRELAEAERRLKHAEDRANRDLAQEAGKKQEARNTVSELREALADEKVKLAHAVGACTEEKEDKRACRDSLLVELATAQAKCYAAEESATKKLGSMEESMACAREEMSEMESELQRSMTAEDKVLRLELELATASMGRDPGPGNGRKVRSHRCEGGPIVVAENARRDPRDPDWQRMLAEATCYL
ncbi:hypothetical protein AK812_SmicGene42835 [Symbiodinium microadriaticum]|uniref:Uncharacterized protein n=1 Tax=Symbiodinium microadriaticum TaxID=2951 RepID=A0A1Q9C2J7_SYMMI|nr:hypothetical protein AK812_SmicGene42835 [Symbiodinium microadriaticum]